MKDTKAFTLIELLVVIAIIGLLSSVVLAALNSARDKGRIGTAKHFAAQTEHVAGDSAVAIWDFDECSGTVSTADRSGFNNTGAFVGSPGPTYDTSTPLGLGCSLAFNGTSAYVSVLQGAGTNLNLSSFESFSITTWFNLTDAASIRPLFGAGYAYSVGGSGIILTYNYPTANKFGYVINNGSGGNLASTFTTSPAITFGTWNHAAVVLSSSTISLFINGVFAGSSDISSKGISNLGNNNFAIGDYGPGGPYFWKGSLDNMRVYSKGFTASEIGRLYASEVSRFQMAINAYTP